MINILAARHSSILLDTGEEIEYNMANWPVDTNGKHYLKGYCKYENNSVIKKTNSEILNEYKLKKLDDLKCIIKSSWPLSTKTPDQIRSQFQTLKTQSTSWTTTAQVDDAYNTAIQWMGL